MISNSNQIPKSLKLLKHIVIEDVVREFNSFSVSNFKFHKFHPFLLYTLNFKRKYIQVYKINITNNKFNYNLKFDVFSNSQTKKTLVITNETSVFGNSTPIEFDYNLILGGLQ